jgi:hypothetical protein
MPDLQRFRQAPRYAAAQAAALDSRRQATQRRSSPGGDRSRHAIRWRTVASPRDARASLSRCDMTEMDEQQERGMHVGERPHRQGDAEEVLRVVDADTRFRAMTQLLPRLDDRPATRGKHGHAECRFDRTRAGRSCRFRRVPLAAHRLSGGRGGVRARRQLEARAVVRSGCQPPARRGQSRTSISDARSFVDNLLAAPESCAAPLQPPVKVRTDRRRPSNHIARIAPVARTPIRWPRSPQLLDTDGDLLAFAGEPLPL